MNARKIVATSFPVTALAKQWGTRILTVSVLSILFLTLFPFYFDCKSGCSIAAIANSFHHQSNLRDWLSNILLFIPLGFGLTCLAQKLALKSIMAIAMVLSASASLSFTVEVLQAFLPARSSTVDDIVANTIGGILGYACFCLAGGKVFSFASKLARNIKRSLCVKNLVLAALGYAGLAIAISVALQNATNFSNWERSFPLILGNENTGDRPWQGYISELYIANKSLAQTEVDSILSQPNLSPPSHVPLVAAYQLTGNDFRDRAGYLPALSWQGQPLDTQDSRGVLLNSHRWLSTKVAADFLTEQLQKTSQFTLITTVATTDIKQTGLARIISLSADPYQRNFTLGQEQTDLVLRLRTPITGKNGNTPALAVPDVFADTNFHKLVITYDGSTIWFYVDKLQQVYHLKLSPELTLFHFVLPFYSWDIRLGTFQIGIYKAVYYGLVFIPLGTCFALIVGKFLYRYRSLYRR
jgi:glycopeptide antibiotics resistance protein